MAAIPLTTVDTGKQLAMRAAAQDDWVVFAPGRCLVVDNASAGAVDIHTSAWFDRDTAQDDIIATVPAGEMWLVPLSARYTDAQGNVNIEYESIVTVTVGVVDFPKIGSHLLHTF